MNQPADVPSLSISQSSRGVSFRVRVQPRAARDELGAISNGVLKVRLTSPPVKGAANAHCIDFLSRRLGVSKGRLSILKGAQSREKLVRVEGLSSQQVLEALAENRETRDPGFKA